MQRFNVLFFILASAVGCYGNDFKNFANRPFSLEMQESTNSYNPVPFSPQYQPFSVPSKLLEPPIYPSHYQFQPVKPVQYVTPNPPAYSPYASSLPLIIYNSSFLPYIQDKSILLKKKSTPKKYKAPTKYSKKIPTYTGFTPILTTKAPETPDVAKIAELLRVKNRKEELTTEGIKSRPTKYTTTTENINMKELEESASFIEEQNFGGAPSGSNDRLEFQMHGHNGPHSYKWGFDTGKGKGHERQFRYEERDNDGHLKGHYGFYDKHGKLRVVNYEADPHTGFHVHPE